MRRLALLVTVIAAAITNLVFIGFAQDVAYRSYETVARDASRYSAVGSVIVPIAAEYTSIQLLVAALPLGIAFLAYRRRWPLAVSIALLVAVELLIAAWCTMVYGFARMPFSTG